MLPEGDYQATILRAFLGFKRTGEAAACLELGIRDAANQPYRETWAGGFEGEWLGRTVRALRLAGWEGNDLKTIGTLKGRKIDITAKHKKSKGRNGVEYTNLNIFINPRKTMDEAEANDFAASMVRAIASVGQPEPEDDGPPNAPPPADFDEEPVGAGAAREPGADDDDIPT